MVFSIPALRINWAVKEILSILPQEDIVYFGDTGRVPYGTRSKETIMKYAKQDMAFLQSKNVKMIIAACGTVSSVAGHIGEALSLPFTGVLKAYRFGCLSGYT
ncbi:MAG: glutamate racemase [Eubacteriales bacterium]